MSSHLADVGDWHEQPHNPRGMVKDAGPYQARVGQVGDGWLWFVLELHGIPQQLVIDRGQTRSSSAAFAAADRVLMAMYRIWRRRMGEG